MCFYFHKECVLFLKAVNKYQQMALIVYVLIQHLQTEIGKFKAGRRKRKMLFLKYF